MTIHSLELIFFQLNLDPREPKEEQRTQMTLQLKEWTMTLFEYNLYPMVNKVMNSEDSIKQQLFRSTVKDPSDGGKADKSLISKFDVKRDEE